MAATSLRPPWIRAASTQTPRRRSRSEHSRSGAVEHVLIDCKQDFFDDGHYTPDRRQCPARAGLSACASGQSADLQAARLAQLARERGATTVAHGCTAAGNDQVRFEVALRTLNPGLDILAPVRDNSWVREEQLRYLEEHVMPLPGPGLRVFDQPRPLGNYDWRPGDTDLGEHDSRGGMGSFGERFLRPRPPTQHTLEFDAGVPIGLDGEAMSPVELIESLELLAGRYGIGRGIHLGDTVLGTKGRVAFEAPAAITLITAHRELEKLVLSAQQMRVKDTIAAVYGDLVHEGKQLDLVCADIEAFLRSSQQRVTGTVRFALRPGNLFIEGIDSDHSLLAATKRCLW